MNETETETYRQWMAANYPFDMARLCRKCVTQHIFGCHISEHAPLVRAAKDFFKLHGCISANNPEQTNEILSVRLKYDWMFRKPTLLDKVRKFFGRQAR